MNWIYLLIYVCVLVGALVGLHLWWRRRLRAAAAQWRTHFERLHQQKEQARVEAQQRQEALFNSMSQGLLLLGYDDRIQFANGAFRSIFGLTGDICGRALMEVLRLHELTELLASSRALGQVTRQELKLTAPVERWLEVSVTPLLSEGEAFSGAVVVFHDLTRIKQSEITRKDFVANVSHELRTPLSLVKGYVETLLDGASEDPELRKKFLNTIAQNAERLELLIEDLLIISELESSRIQLHLEPVPLAEVVSKVFEDFQERAVSKRTMLRNQSTGFMVHADRGRLEQVLANLVDNALKYGGNEGEIVIGASRTNDGFVEVFVRNDGPGIPAESLSRLFERFYRVDKGRSREQGGTGLGLAIVKHIVQSHGGRVRAASEPGQGATFFFTLPEESQGREESNATPQEKSKQAAFNSHSG